jgi:hypothetical protein
MIRKIFTRDTGIVAILEAHSKKAALNSIANAKASQSNASFFNKAPANITSHEPSPNTSNNDPVELKKNNPNK